MPRIALRSLRRWLAIAALAAAVAVPGVACAQVVVVANGLPVTAYDIEQRTKLITVSTHKAPSRQEVIQELIDDRLKISRAKSYGFEVPDTEVDQAFGSMAKNQHITTQQFSEVLERAGIAPNTIKARIRAELTWSQLVRGKFSSSLEVSEGEITDALRTRNEGQGDVAGYIYTLYPVIVLLPPGSSQAVAEGRIREAENLRGRFVNCNEGLAISRAMRDVAVREPVARSSADLPQQLRDVLAAIPIGHLTTPEATAQGLQMFALCAKKESKVDSPLKREVRLQIYQKKFDAESKRFLDEIRKQSMIEYKEAK